eukprot:TRINITY_DN26757_c0_g1_i1.p1 TRINITY_DN26757_c0_g1~~TRINITY_DN26757_c0_g1_i1.p1  ORF type:complete len:323 (-),score=66.80 TRINITY_DN26757_c0_g1_i1:66-1034(-)
MNIVKSARNEYYFVHDFAGLHDCPGNRNGRLQGESTLNTPCGIAIDHSDNIFIADYKNGHIRKINGGVMSSIPIETGFPPGPICVSPKGHIYFADSHSVQMLSTSNCIPIGEDQFSAILGLAVDKNQNIYVSDYEQSKVFKISSDHKTITSIAHLFQPFGIAVSRQGDIYVTNSNGLYKVSYQGGEYVTRTVNDKLVDPLSLLIDEEENIWVCQGNSIIKLDPQGSFLDRISYGGKCWGVAKDRLGAFYVTEWQNHCVLKMVKNDWPWTHQLLPQDVQRVVVCFVLSVSLCAHLPKELVLQLGKVMATLQLSLSTTTTLEIL